MDNSDIRVAKRNERGLLSAEQVATASLEVSAALWRLPFMSRSNRIAVYFAVGREIDCRFLIEEAWSRGRKVFLPVVTNDGMAFAQYRASTPILRNRFGIPEPVCAPARFINPSDIDVVLAPLVAFDERGNRIGMGAGFYDRSFRFLKQRTRWLRPRLVGLAHELQKAAQIKASSWDVPLHTVVTDRRTYLVR